MSESTTYTVTGMSCEHCVRAVTDEVSGVSGVTGVDVDLATGRLNVVGDGPVDGEAVVTELDREGFAVSSGSSCTASTLQPSHVLAAMGVLTHGNVRVSLGRGTTEADVDRFLAVLPGLVERLRAQSGASGL